MDIKWIGASPRNYGKGRSGRTINKLVLHWIVGTLESAGSTFANPDNEVSSHYGVGDNDVHQYVREEDTAWHAGNLVANRESIGIEHEGGWLLGDSKIARFKPTDKTHETSAKLVAEVCERYGIPIDSNHIKLHRDFKATQCPGSLDVDRIIQMANDLAVPEPEPEPEITDKTKIDMGEPWGIMEVQAIKSTLNDQKDDLEECEKSKNSAIKEAVDKANKEKDLFWQIKVEIANEEWKLKYETLLHGSVKKVSFWDFIKIKLRG